MPRTCPTSLNPISFLFYSSQLSSIDRIHPRCHCPPAPAVLRLAIEILASLITAPSLESILAHLRLLEPFRETFRGLSKHSSSVFSNLALLDRFVFIPAVTGVRPSTPSSRGILWMMGDGILRMRPLESASPPTPATLVARIQYPSLDAILFGILEATFLDFDPFPRARPMIIHGGPPSPAPSLLYPGDRGRDEHLV